MGNCIKHVLSYFKSFSVLHRISGKKLRQVRQIAEGGYGFVSLVEDIQTNRLYAMKKMICQSNQQKQMFRHQVKVLKQLAHCPHIITYYGSHEIERDGFLQGYILMQYGQKTVYDMLLQNNKKNNIKLSQKQILKILKETALALQQMHQVGILHHDVKVENILITKEGVAKLCDFGSSTKQRVDLSVLPKSSVYKFEERFQKNTTLMYRPPQMIDVYLKYPVDQRVDIWMLGCVLFVLNFNYHPFQDEGKLGIVNTSIKYPKTASPKMQKFLRHILTPNPFYRPSVKQIIQIIDKWDNTDFQLNEVAAKIFKNEQHMEKDEFQMVQKHQLHKMRPDEQWNQFQSQSQRVNRQKEINK